LRSPQRPQAPITDRKAERELFFWTAFQTLRLLVTTALAIYLILTLIEHGSLMENLLIRSLRGQP
jgi:hypothetical protein